MVDPVDRGQDRDEDGHYDAVDVDRLRFHTAHRSVEGDPGASPIKTGRCKIFNIGFYHGMTFDQMFS